MIECSPHMAHTVNISPVDMEARKALDLSAGDTVRVVQKIQEKGKVRLQAFEGLILARKHGTEAGGTFTVRRVSNGIGVEKIFPLYSPMIDKIEILKSSRVRRAKLYFIREKVSREVRRQLRRTRVVGSRQNDKDTAEPIEVGEEVTEETAAVAE